MGLCLALLGLSALILAFLPGRQSLVLLLWLGFAAAMAWDALWLARRRVVLSADPPREVEIGQTVTLAVDAAGAGPGARLRLDWPEGLEGPADTAVTPGAAPSFEVRFRGIRRGEWPLPTFWLISPAPLALMTRIQTVRPDAALTVLPDTSWTRSGQIEVELQGTLFGSKAVRARGEGSEFHQLQEFQSGMDVRAIDWKQSARTRRLIVKEMRAEQNHHIMLGVDCGLLMAAEMDGLPRLDHAINAGLSLAWAGALAGDQVGLFAYDAEPRRFVPPRPGREGFRKLRSELASLDYARRETNHTLGLARLATRCPRRSLIVLFADFVDITSAELMVETLAALAKRHAIVMVSLRDPSLHAQAEAAPNQISEMATLIAARQLIDERALVLRKLADLGVEVVDVVPRRLSPALVSRYLDLKAREVL